ncbi:hypothetical protein Taro_045544 [Colocasia esculenta]|uniref:DDE Tnp4 domain-containing protein n=1 Tax=Colocasia esculenta TaxID=4460 RepID=A0A843X2Y2_COLES|nr:hypothetical protein [Colocasia esculenta]
MKHNQGRLRNVLCAMCEHFQHSSKTISYYVNRVIKAIALLSFTYIVLPSGTDPVHPRIRHDDRFYPYFKDAIGAIDGTYIPAHVLKDRQAHYRNRKNVISQNVMGICGFGHIFHYVGVGFDGAAADMTVLRRAIDVGGLQYHKDYYFNLRQMDNVEEEEDPLDDPNLVVTPPDMQAGEILRTQIATQIWVNN